MQFTMLVATAIAALFTSTDALAVRNKHVSDFRIYGVPGCFRENIGVWTVIDEDFQPNECKSLNADRVGSVLLGNINSGCTLSLYTDATCTAGKTTTAAGQCQDAAQGWKAWSMECH